MFGVRQLVSVKGAVKGLGGAKRSGLPTVSAPKMSFYSRTKVGVDKASQTFSQMKATITSQTNSSALRFEGPNNNFFQLSAAGGNYLHILAMLLTCLMALMDDGV
eukprot:TRINITY_DN5307_c0_g1_i1.p1 TRINITY_DN5307_c0_g1~~TRINITY_DN5307_c0_g1_i1.p1  ORF type:complete len:105 (-),score=28.20 TRINITY_DN5307_c0_g1_i1:72-386(-)